MLLDSPLESEMKDGMERARRTMDYDVAQVRALFERAVQGHRGALSRLLTLAESGVACVADVAARYDGPKGRVIGITGPPGAGKSSLINQLVEVLRERQRRVAVLAVDPSSPVSRGAVLADRIRMQRHALDPGVFIRSAASRKHLGGLAPGSRLSVEVLRAAANDDVLVETVGVGQNEVEIMDVADVVTVVLCPGGGDGIQIMKSGVMEIADVFVVNKADIEGAQDLAREVRLWGGSRNGWTPPVVLASSVSRAGIEEWASAIDEHLRHTDLVGKRPR